MSIRIETIAQLKDPKLVEQVLDRLRRTTEARHFLFKQRCKALNDKAVLLTAPPGRKLKSSLVKELRLGSPTLFGTMHRVEQDLFFHFTTEVNKEHTARWIAHCLQDAKSPVPLKHIIIQVPSDFKEKKKNKPQKTQLQTSNNSNAPLKSDVVSEKGLQLSDDEALTLQEFSEHEYSDITDFIEDVDALTPIFTQYLPSKITSKIQGYLTKWNELSQQVTESQEGLSQIEQGLNDLKNDLHNPQKFAMLEQELQSWMLLKEAINAANFSMADYRHILDESSLDLQDLQKELQFIENEVQAYRLLQERWQEKISSLSTALQPNDPSEQIKKLQKQLQSEQYQRNLLLDEFQSFTQKLQERLQVSCIKAMQKMLNTSEDDLHQLIQMIQNNQQDSNSKLELKALLLALETMQNLCGQQ